MLIIIFLDLKVTIVLYKVKLKLIMYMNEEVNDVLDQIISNQGNADKELYYMYIKMTVSLSFFYEKEAGNKTRKSD